MSDSTTLNIIYMLAAGGKDVLTQKMMKKYGIFLCKKRFPHIFFFCIHNDGKIRLVSDHQSSRLAANS